MCDVPCLVCGTALKNYDERLGVNHPCSGVEFTSHGHYGSSFVDGTYIAINICDPCMVKAKEQHRVLISAGRIQHEHRQGPEQWAVWEKIIASGS